MNLQNIYLRIFPFIAFMVILYSDGCKKEDHNMTAIEKIQKQISRFAPTQISADTTGLSPGDRHALKKLIEAGKIMDNLFLEQIWSGDSALLEKLANRKSKIGKLKLQYFMINGVPWSRLDNDTAFIDGVPPTPPPGANFYPDYMTKEEFETWLKELRPKEQEQAKGFFTTIRRDENRRLKIVPYNIEYAEDLKHAAALLKEAAALTENASLKNFLLKRAASFLSNDYYASDVAWMEVDAPIDVTIGPYETYQDKIFGYKATFEAFVTLRDEKESTKLKKFSSYLQELENNLPMSPKYRNPKLGAASPIRVVDEVFAGGDTKGVQTAAFNLPNDEKVVKEKGSKRVMLKNVQEAKFNKILIPISRVILDKEQQADVLFESFFTHTLAHELMHGLGPHNIIVNGKPATVRTTLQELYSAIEEAKADITGLWALQYLIDKGVLEKSMEKTMYTTFLAGVFRSVRFGINEAHGKGIALQFNYLMDDGAISHNSENGTFHVNIEKMKESVRKLTGEILTLQAEGNKEEAKKMLEKYVIIRPEMQRALDKLNNIPVDIAPEYTLAK
ncbi:MAG: hypothetical protein ABSB78_13320 [Bacteroidota bacterium]